MLSDARGKGIYPIYIGSLPFPAQQIINCDRGSYVNKCISAWLLSNGFGVREKVTNGAKHYAIQLVSDKTYTTTRKSSTNDMAVLNVRTTST
jgi:hypothetical protein